MTAPTPANNSTVLRPQEMKKIKTYLINVISRELESNPPPILQRREIVIQCLQQAYADLKI